MLSHAFHYSQLQECNALWCQILKCGPRPILWRRLIWFWKLWRTSSQNYLVYQTIPNWIVHFLKLNKITYNICFHWTPPEVLLVLWWNLHECQTKLRSFPCPQKLDENPESDLCVCLTSFQEIFKFSVFPLLTFCWNQLQITEMQG